MHSQATEVAVAIAGPLQIKPHQILDFLKINIGDAVNKSTVLAVKKSLFGLNGISLQSPVEGVVHNIDLQQGTVIIDINPLTEVSHLQSAVADPVDFSPPAKSQTSKPAKWQDNAKFKRTATSDHDRIEGIFGCGKTNGRGWLVEYNFNSQAIVSEMEGRIILVTQMPDLATIFKASAIGVSGFVVAAKNLDAKQLENIKSQLQNKSHVAFLVLPDDVNLTTLHGIDLELDGDQKNLYFAKRNLS